MTRPALALVVLAVAAGCAETPRLPPDELLGEPALAVATHGDVGYWVEGLPTSMALHELRGGEDRAAGRRTEVEAGELAARTLATTRLTETWIHTVDVVVAFGPPPAPTGACSKRTR